LRGATPPTRDARGRLLALVQELASAQEPDRNKNDDTDAMIIARLVTEVGAARQQIRDLLECAWLAMLSAVRDPLEFKSRLAAAHLHDRRLGRPPVLPRPRRRAGPGRARRARPRLRGARRSNASARGVRGCPDPKAVVR
jgi:hypothetical protein